MTNKHEICPRCGDSIETARSTRAERGDPSLCDACYFENFELVDAPDRITVRHCTQCGAVHQGNRWVDIGAQDYTDIAVEAVRQSLGVHVDADSITWRVEPEQVDNSTIRMHCHFSGAVRETPVEETVVVPVTLAAETCTRCGRIAGDYYASVVQVRAVDREPTDEEQQAAREIAEDVVSSMEETGDRNAFITETGEVAGGLDMKVSTTKIGRKIADKIVNRFGGAVSASETLVTEDADGNEVYRVTYAVRLPPYKPGDIITIEDLDDPILVDSVKGNLKGRYITTGEAYETEYDIDDFPEAQYLGSVSDGEETTVVNVEDKHAVQVLDPDTYESKTIARPAYFDSSSEMATVLKSRAGLHILPSDHD